ncbi:hypothetical protein SAMN05216206_0104 [Pseudomonas guineae]|uniref:Uncharacterized protein n=1 Tax=Pseudomonas guineae TaxID=425504 RepID=A0A1I3CJZ1_9PSED|nr:DUF6387 family protein [Pseudomonas guineae]SFH74646.1 hypothetical protein SAMN05216206_0104 [Pseudomonas guineae]
MAKIDRVEDLPEWFDLEKYKGAESFGVTEWIYHLRNRWHLFDSFDELKKQGITVESFPGSDHWLPGNLERFRSDPLRVEEGLSDVLHPPVRDMAFGDLAGQRYFEDHAACQDEYSADDVEYWQFMAACDEPVREGLAASVGLMKARMSPGFPLMVDLRATDSVLITAFSRWLKNERAKQPASTSSKRELPAYNDWAGFGLLPYLDLTLWEGETGNKLTLNIMAQAVGYFRGGDSFRKTVPSLAAKLMHSLNELECLGVIESATPDKPEKLDSCVFPE